MPVSAQDKLWQRVSGASGRVWHPAAMRTGESRWDEDRSRWDEPAAPARYAASKVPLITAYFWIIKLLTTAMGEATSDYMVRTINPVTAVLLGFTAFVIAMVLQLRAKRYVAWTYWLAVAMVAVFGTQAADVLHIKFHVPHPAAGTVLLGHGAGHVRARHRDRRPDRQDPDPRLPRVGHLVRPRVRGGGGGALEVRPEPDPGLLDLLRADPAGRRVVRGLRGVPAVGGRPGRGARAGRPVPDVPDRDLR